MPSKSHRTQASHLFFNSSTIISVSSRGGGGGHQFKAWGPNTRSIAFQGSGDGQQRGEVAGEHTHISVVVIQLHHNAGRLLGDTGWLTEDLYLIEDEGLIPGGVQGVLLHHCLLALMQEGDDSIGIWVGQVRKETRLSCWLRNSEATKPEHGCGHHSGRITCMPDAISEASHNHVETEMA